MCPDPLCLPSTNDKPGILIDFIIVGGGITGLACALALRRTGHRVIVLEKLVEQEISILGDGGSRLPPNASKILFQWGLEAAIREFAVSSSGVEVMRCELLGTHPWEEEILREVGGEYLFYHHADLWLLLLRAAKDAGADLRLGVRVTSVDEDDCSVKLSGGDVLRADVIVAAVGPLSGLRTALSSNDNCLHDSTPAYCRLYSLLVPSHIMLQDHLLSQLYMRPSPSTFLWLGHRASALGSRVGGVDAFMVHIWVSDYSRPTSDENEWIAEADKTDWEDLINYCEPRLQKLVQGANFRAFGPVQFVPKLNYWVHHSGRVAVVGEAAHPLPAGSMQLTALGIEDAAVFAKLFSHLMSEDQISTFLRAFQDLREARCTRVLESEQRSLISRMMPDSPEQEERDNIMRERHSRGLGVLGSGGGKLAEQWDEVKELFGYNAEDEADDWWVNWGLLRERAKQRSIGLDEPIHIGLKAVSINNDDEE